MSIQSQSSDIAIGGKRYTGLANMLVTAISPSIEELKAAGKNPNKEPEYLTKEFVDAKTYNGGPNGTYEVSAYHYTKMRLDIAVIHPELKFTNKLAIWLEDRVRWNKDHDGVEWINIYGDTAWTTKDQIAEGSQLEKCPSWDWFKTDGARPALGGEGQLCRFLKAWANTPLGQQGRLDNPNALAQGDLTEMRSLLKALATNQVKLLNGIKKVAGENGKISYFPAIYTGYFQRASINDFNPWREALANPYSKFDADYQNDLTLREYIGDSKVEGVTPTNMSVPGAAPVTGSGAPAGGWKF